MVRLPFYLLFLIVLSICVIGAVYLLRGSRTISLSEQSDGIDGQEPSSLNDGTASDLDALDILVCL